jgi:hypothetical protein
MTITTEEAERLAHQIDCGYWGFHPFAAAIRSLAAERDALKVERDSWITKYNTQVDYRIRAEAEFSHMQRRIARQRRALAKLYQRRHDRKAENARLREALRLAIDAVEFWAAYATPYFQDKHDLADDLQKLRAALGETQ